LSVFEKIQVGFFREGSSVPDLGCGTGRTTIILDKMGFNVLGGDYSNAMIERAKKFHPHLKFLVMDADIFKISVGLAKFWQSFDLSLFCRKAERNVNTNRFHISKSRRRKKIFKCYSSNVFRSPPLLYLSKTLKRYL
jgi:SAM-dependent methyltransferase